MNIGQKIKTLRKKNLLTVDELAQLINKDRATIYRYERGNIKSIPYDIVNSLAKALGVSTTYFYENTDSQQNDSDLDTFSSQPLKGNNTEELKLTLISLITSSNLSQSQLEALITIIKSIK